MKKIILVAIAIFSLLSYSCKEEITPAPVDETAGLLKVQEISNDTSVVELYTRTGAFMLGYNDVYIRIKNKTTNAYATDATISWSPMMHMMSMTHSCPKSAIVKVPENQSLYKGYLVFQMPENASEHWTLALSGVAGGTTFSVEDTVSVPNSTRKRVTVVTGSDSKKYILALVAPETPSVALNDMTLGLFTMQSMMSFPVVKDYKVDIDPRMPSMANHGSPNNENLTYGASDSLYHGKLSLTMTGYWKINMLLKNTADEVLKGEAVTTDNESSSLYLELEF